VVLIPDTELLSCIRNPFSVLKDATYSLPQFTKMGWSDCWSSGMRGGISPIAASQVGCFWGGARSLTYFCSSWAIGKKYIYSSILMSFDESLRCYTSQLRVKLLLGLVLSHHLGDFHLWKNSEPMPPLHLRAIKRVKSPKNQEAKHLI